MTLERMLGRTAFRCRRALTDEMGVALPPLVDHHVHLHLIDAQPLTRHGISAVLDLGGDPVALARRRGGGVPHVFFAGAFLTAVGGYPSGRSWAPPATVREVSDPSVHPGVSGGAATAVDEQASSGASVIKVALNSDAGPVPDDAVLRAIVAAARSHALPVVAHAQGVGMAQRAIDAGVDALAHTPFSERLDAALIERAAASGQRWISTLDIMRDDPRTRECATQNLRAFRAAGGTVLYGTDLGNGDLPVGINVRELAALHQAGVQGAELIATLTDPWPASAPSHAVSTFIPGQSPTHLDDVPAWLGGASIVPTEELIHDEHH